MSSKMNLVNEPVWRILTKSVLMAWWEPDLGERKGGETLEIQSIDESFQACCYKKKKVNEALIERRCGV